MNQKGHKKLLLIGSSKGAGHLLNFKALIAPYFDEILLVSGHVVKDQQAHTFNFGLKNPLQFFKTIRELRKLILDFKPDVIHVHQANSYGFLSALANRGLKPLVLTTWGSDVLLLPQKNSFYKFMVGYALKQANAITADAHFMAKAIEELAPNKAVQIANFGVEIEKLAAPIEKEKLKSRLLLQIHDELILEVVAGEEEKISELVKREMGSAYPLKAPLDVNAGLGLTWHEAAH